MDKVELAKAIFEMLGDFIENKVVYVESDTYYEPYSGQTDPSVKSEVCVSKYNFEEYLNKLKDGESKV